MTTLTAVKKEKAKKKIFKGIHLDSLAAREKSIVCKMNYQNGDFASGHSHPHKQCGYVVSGEYELTIRDKNGF